MQYIHIYSEEKVVRLDFELDGNYEVGTTYEDYLNGAWVPLNAEQKAFYETHPAASAKEILECELIPPYEPTLEGVKSAKVNEIAVYDGSDAVNSFTLGGKRMWLDKDIQKRLDKDTRVGLVNSITIEQAVGKETTVLWYDTVKYVIPIPLALQMLAALELYALECYNVTQEHLAVVMGLATKEEVGAYDYTSGYPEKLVFNL